MRRKIFLIGAIVVALIAIMATSAFADGIKKFETDEFQSGDNITYLEGVNTDSYLTDDGRNTDITTYLDNDKLFARAVLKNSDDTYTTYPAWYVFNFVYDWRGSYQYSTVDRLNALSEVTGETYTIEDIIRIEYLEFNAAGLQIARTSTATPAYFPNARYVRLPSHFTSMSFFNGYNVEELVIPSECQFVTVGKAAALNCYMLKELILPNTVTTIQAEGINFYSKQSTSQLKLLNLGASLTTLGGTNAIGNCKIPGIRVIVPDTLDGATYGKSYFPSTAVVLFTGTKAQAEAFGFDYIMSYADYEKAGCEAAAGTIVWGYNKCDAFYGGAHIEKLAEGQIDTNPCVITECATCGAKNIDVSSDETHSFDSGVIKYVNGFASAGQFIVSCQNAGCVCNTNPDVTPVPAIYNCLGFAVKEDGTSLTLGYTFNKEAYEGYIANNAENVISFGFVAYATYEDVSCSPLSLNGGVVAPTDGAKTIFASMSVNYAAYDFVIRGFDESTQNFNIAMCAYTYDGSEIKYLCNNTDGVYGAYDVAYATTISKEA